GCVITRAVVSRVLYDSNHFDIASIEKGLEMKRLANRVMSEIEPAHKRIVHHGNVRSAFRISGAEFPAQQQGHALGLEIPWTCKVNLHRRALIRLGRVPRHRDTLNHFHVTQPTVKREAGGVDAGESVDTVQQLPIKR